MAFKLTKLNLRPTQAELKLTHPVGGETDAVIYLVGTLSRQFKEAQREARKALGPDVDFEKLTIEQQAKLLADVYVSCVVGWNAELDEALGPYDPSTAMLLFTDPELDWVGAQVATFVNDTANFFRPVAA